MKILVTGATGHLGRHVCPALTEAGHEIRATDLRQTNDFPVPVLVENLLNREACYRLVEGMDAVVHFGNYPNDILRDRQRLFIENVSMNMNIVQASIELGLKKLIFSSSVQAISGHGRQQPPADGDKHACNLPYLPIDGDSPLQPANAYALSKQVGEDQLAYAARITDMQCIAIRFPWLMNDGQRKWLKRQRETKDFNRRHINEAFTYLSMNDAARLINSIVEADLPGFRHYFPAARANILGMDIQTLIPEAFPDVPLRIPVEQMTSLVDTSRITEETGWSPSE